ncbi:MAG: hypothetical protein FWG61_08780 [Firmicutes bacterium]|nr:hypothetical protein [Bacillota bacterium]
MQLNNLMTLNNTTALAVPASVSNGLNNKLANRSNFMTLHKTQQAMTHENGRAMLAYSAMENVALLSNFEAICCHVAPSGGHRYKQIVDAYALSAIFRIAGW